jgi:hypothetical protein
VDEFTYAAGIVDVQNIDLDGMLERLARIGTPRDEVNQWKQLAASLRTALVRSGAHYVGFAFNLADSLDDGPLLVIPTGKDGNANDVANQLKQDGMQTKVKDNTVLAGAGRTLERALERKAGAVPEFAKAFAAVETLPARVAFTIPPVLCRSAEELMPTLGKEYGGGPITSVTRGMSWGAVGLDLSADKLQLRAVVQARDAQAATELGRLIDRFLEKLRKQAAHDEAADLLKGLQTLKPKAEGDQLRLALDAKALDTAILPLIANIREQAIRGQSIENLKHLALAMHNYHDVYKSFPAQASYDKKDRPLLSWRVHLLPYLDQKALYAEFKLDEPWDSPHNKKLIAKMPKVFRSPFIVDAAAGKTTYLVPAGPELIFDGPKQTKISQITDGTSNTILVVEANESKAVWWTQPEDYAVDRKNPKAGLVRTGSIGILAAFADGSVQILPRTTRDEVMWLYFCPNDGMSIPREP